MRRSLGGGGSSAGSTKKGLAAPGPGHPARAWRVALGPACGPGARVGQPEGLPDRSHHGKDGTTSSSHLPCSPCRAHFPGETETREKLAGAGRGELAGTRGPAGVGAGLPGIRHVDLAGPRSRRPCRKWEDVGGSGVKSAGAGENRGLDPNSVSEASGTQVPSTVTPGPARRLVLW